MLGIRHETPGVSLVDPVAGESLDHIDIEDVDCWN
jgi:hypothetical protein